jgi:uncharacterized protein (TIGR00255 family)
MIFSMTGYGSGETVDGEIKVSASLRSVNSRFVDIQLRLPSELHAAEGDIRERLQSQVSRGKITAVVEIDQSEMKKPLPRLDEAVVARYVEELLRLQQMPGLNGSADISTVVQLPGVFQVESVVADDETLKALALAAIERALIDFNHMRQVEGQALEGDLRTRIHTIEGHLVQIEALAGGVREKIAQRLRDKVEVLLRPGEVAEERLALEISLLAERSDITEEFVRFHSHNAQFLAALDKGDEVGRRLNFLVQEMNREANTIGSKASETEIVHLAVEIKEEIERVREQIQNLA